MAWKKCCRTGQTTGGHVTRRMRIACWITNATDTHPDYEILIALHINNGYANAPQCCVCMYIACLVQYFLPTECFCVLFWSRNKQFLTAESQFRSQARSCEICGRVSLDQVFLRVLRFVTFYQCCILIFINVLPLPAGLQARAGSFPKRSAASEIRQHWMEKCFLPPPHL